MRRAMGALDALWSGADKERLNGEEFFMPLSNLCRLWGYFDEKRIFSKDLTLPSTRCRPR